MREPRACLRVSNINSNVVLHIVDNDYSEIHYYGAILGTLKYIENSLGIIRFTYLADESVYFNRKWKNKWDNRL